MLIPRTLNPRRCPRCDSDRIERDSASPWIVVGAILLFPIGLLFFLLNRNAWCRDCGTRFKCYSRVL